MNHKALLQLGSELMFEFRHGSMAADKALSDYFRARKFLGSHDRDFLADTYFHVLRNLRRYDEAISSAFQGTTASEPRFSSGFPVTDEIAARAWWPGEKEVFRQRFADRLMDTLRLSVAAIELEYDSAEVLAEEVNRVWEQLPEKSRRFMKAETLERLLARSAELANMFRTSPRPTEEDRAFSFPSWMWSSMAQSVSRSERTALGESLGGQAPIAVRVNLLKTTIEEAERVLNEGRIEFKRGDLSPEALILSRRVSRSRFPRMQDGWFEMQDEGSQLISHYADPKPGMSVIDVCAGGGGKTLHMVALMNNEGKVYALDVGQQRLANLAKRAYRTGAAIVDDTAVLGKNGEPPSLEKLPPADLVLLDVPCSGTGTLRRNPELRWRFNMSRMETLLRTQESLLEIWKDRVKPGGLLVYATCSLIRDENEAQIDRFLGANPEFKIEAPENSKVELTERGEMRLFPHRHGCDGFYSARMRRSES